jgi:protein-tyrosine phosphatase
MPRSGSAHNSGLRVLLVCTGNICRSPLAEQLLRAKAHGLGDHQNFQFDSAGVMAEVGQGLYPDTVASMQRFGLEPQSHTAKQLNAPMLESADLVLTATAEHRAEIARVLVRANRYTFTHKEFVRIGKFLKSDLTHLPEADQEQIRSASSPKEMVELISKYRGYAARPETSEDIIDPWGRDAATFDLVTEELIWLVESTFEILGAR